MKSQLRLVCCFAFAGIVNISAMNHPRIPHARIPQQNTIDLNTVNEYFELHTGAANLIVAPHVNMSLNYTPEEQEIRGLLQRLPQQNTYLTVIPVGERYPCLMCTRTCTIHLKEIYGNNLRNFHAYRPRDSKSVDLYFPGVGSDIAIAMHLHGDLPLPPQNQ